MFTREPLPAWRSRECQEFYAESAPRAAPPGLRFDASSGLFLPPRRGRSTPIKRMRTREDTLDVAHCRLRAADARALHVPIPKRVNAAFGVPIARGTVQRPGKAFVVEGSRRFIALAIEKSGLSSLAAAEVPVAPAAVRGVRQRVGLRGGARDRVACRRRRGRPALSAAARRRLRLRIDL